MLVILEHIKCQILEEYMTKYISFRICLHRNILKYFHNDYIWHVHLNLDHIFLSLVFLHALLMVIYGCLRENIFSF